MSLPHHPLADIFPLIEGEDFAGLVAAIKANGLREPIVVHEGAVLDGRNRQRACIAADVDCIYTPFPPDADPLAFVIDKNLARRHLDESQRAMVAARIANMRQGERTDLEHSANLPKVDQPAAAARLSISERALRLARTVQMRGSPELVRAVDQGRLAVAAAAKAVTLAVDLQRQVADEAFAGRANAARSVIKRHMRDNRERVLGALQLALPDKRYGLILADPEWRFEPYSRETGMDRAADNHYSTTPTADICARPVADIAAPDCVLALWATAPMLPDALAVMAAWGFAYKTHCIWHKLRPGDGRGSGYWFTGEHELLLIGTRGRIVAPATALCGSVVAAPWQGRHSAKPEAFAELLERAYPTLPKIELNRRGPPRPGWDAWGFEAETSSASLRAPPSKPAPSAPDTPKSNPSSDSDSEKAA